MFKNKLVPLVTLMVLFFVAGCSRTYTISNAETKVYQLSDSITIGELEDVTLTIYYTYPCRHTRTAWRVDDLIHDATSYGRFSSFTTISGSELGEQDLELLQQITNEIFVPVKKQGLFNVRLYYVLESKKNGKLFDVAFNIECSNIFVNGVEVEQNARLIEFVLPFLPESVSEMYGACQVACDEFSIFDNVKTN